MPTGEEGVADAVRLYVLHAVPATHPFSWHQSERLELLTSLRQRAERDSVAVRAVEQHGDPAGVIVLHANARKADLVSSNPTGDAVGSGSERVPSENVCSAARRGQY
jgi:nucleotide-binding universal stress UspA family protein